MLQSMNPNQQLADVVVDVIEENKRIENNKNYSNTKTLSHQNNTFVTSSHFSDIFPDSKNTMDFDISQYQNFRALFTKMYPMQKDFFSIKLISCKCNVYRFVKQLSKR